MTFQGRQSQDFPSIAVESGSVDHYLVLAIWNRLSELLPGTIRSPKSFFIATAKEKLPLFNNKKLPSGLIKEVAKEHISLTVLPKRFVGLYFWVQSIRI